MAKLLNIAGRRFDGWLVIDRAPTIKKPTKWNCKCDCGVLKAVRLTNLRAGKSRSCGCLGNIGRFTHGMSKVPEYNIWKNMIARCIHPSQTSYKNYGGRGIKVCSRWKDFQNFFDDMGQKPNSKMQLDRKNNDGDYEPSNCRWATNQENSQNTTRSRVNGKQVATIKRLLHEGKLNQTEIAKMFEVGSNIIWSIKHGVSWTNIQAEK